MNRKQFKDMYDTVSSEQYTEEYAALSVDTALHTFSGKDVPVNVKSQLNAIEQLCCTIKLLSKSVRNIDSDNTSLGCISCADAGVHKSTIPLVNAIEELNELSVEIIHFLNGKGNTIGLLEEFADVFISLQFMLKAAGIDSDSLQKAIAVKSHVLNGKSESELIKQRAIHEFEKGTDYYVIIMAGMIYTWRGNTVVFTTREYAKQFAQSISDSENEHMIGICGCIPNNSILADGLCITCEEYLKRDEAKTTTYHLAYKEELSV